MRNCLWCKKGVYEKVVGPDSPSWMAERYGISVVGEATWEVWACRGCGNIQFFRTDLKSNGLKVA